MKDTPLPMNGEMVRATLADLKQMTRRVVKKQPRDPKPTMDDGVWSDTKDPVTRYFGCPYGQPGDRLWVRETFYQSGRYVQAYPTDDDYSAWIPRGYKSLDHVRYGADGPPIRGKNAWGREPGSATHSERFIPDDGENAWRKRPSIHMPRWASRITLEVTAVRVERLQDISEADAQAEGIKLLNGRFTFNDGMHESRTAVESFNALWESINRPGSWEKNPWVWVVSFKRITTTTTPPPSEKEKGRE